MELFKHRFVLFFFITIFCCTGCKKQAQQNQNIIAEIGDNYIISFTELQTFVINNFFDKMYHDKSEAFNKALDLMITNQLKRIDFVETGLHNDNELIQNIGRTMSEELIVKYFNSEFLNTYTSDEFVLKAYENMGKEVVYRQIVLMKPENVTKEQNKLLINKANRIKNEIDQGKDFNVLVQQYSEHAESMENDGFIPPLTWETGATNPLFHYIFNHNVNDVFVLETSRAYYIINITDINKIDVEPLEEIRDEIIANLEKEYIDLSLKQYDDAKKELIDESSLEWNRNALNQLVKWSKVRNFYKGNKYRITLQQAIAEGENQTILKHSKGEVDYKEYFRLVDNILIPKESVNITVADIKDYILEALRTDIIVRKAKELGLEKDLFNPNTTNEVIKNRIVWLYNQAVIETQIPEPVDAELQKFYEEHKDSLFYQLAKVNIHALIYSDKTEADKMWQKIKQGIPFKEVTDRWYVKTFIRNKNGQIKSYLSGDPPFLGEAAFQLKESEADGVIEYTDPEKGKQYAIIECSNKRPEKQLTYDDVNDSITEVFKKFHRKRIQQEVAQELRKKYKVVIYKDVLFKKIASVNLQAIQKSRSHRTKKRDYLSG